jgi:hypothetical protein
MSQEIEFNAALMAALNVKKSDDAEVIGTWASAINRQADLGRMSERELTRIINKAAWTGQSLRAQILRLAKIFSAMLDDAN